MDNPDLDRQQIDRQGQEKTIGLHHRACSQRSERLHNRSSGLPKRQEPVIVAIASNLKKMNRSTHLVAKLGFQDVSMLWLCRPPLRESSDSKWFSSGNVDQHVPGLGPLPQLVVSSSEGPHLLPGKFCRYEVFSCCFWVARGKKFFFKYLFAPAWTTLPVVSKGRDVPGIFQGQSDLMTSAGPEPAASFL